MEKGVCGELSALWLLISPLELARERAGELEEDSSVRAEETESSLSLT